MGGEGLCVCVCVCVCVVGGWVGGGEGGVTTYFWQMQLETDIPRRPPPPNHFGVGQNTALDIRCGWLIKHQIFRGSEFYAHPQKMQFRYLSVCLSLSVCMSVCLSSLLICLCLSVPVCFCLSVRFCLSQDR